MRIVSENEVRAWMIANIAERTRRDPGAVDLELPIAAFGLDSLSLLELLGELDEWLDGSIDMAVLEGKSVSQIARRIVDESVRGSCEDPVTLAASGA